ncbi:hypothetical protein [Pelagibaculum spongiae]|uniref:Uncharacterized protein n=1 Tax=Pelagibaculum spongiae TaxID=2080658 RepID=A0A2V1GNI1_9GAMM|nr:hypothetical protein [Pelagibaculum spongiae]PVZ63521.1 hypothetical protein DC094_20775 [Pelagibaculum spongiae]
MKRAEFKAKLTDLLTQSVDGLGKRDKLEYVRDILSCGETGGHRLLQARDEVVEGARVKHAEFSMQDVSRAHPDLSLEAVEPTETKVSNQPELEGQEISKKTELNFSSDSLSLAPLPDNPNWDGLERRKHSDRRDNTDRRTRVRFASGKLSDRRAYRERRQNWPPAD